MAKYFKLGEKASMFFDPTSQLLIRGAEVVMVERVMKTKKLSLALNQGHVIPATEDEFNAFESGVPLKKHESTPEAKSDSDMVKMSDAEFKKAVKEFGFQKKDKDTIMALETREEQVTMYEELAKKYE